MDFFDPTLGLQEDLLEAPNIHDLFAHYAILYFGDSLGACSVEWSKGRMTRCAGICYFRRGAGCTIRLSEPLLKLRPILELKETLLHEMIHAYLMLKNIRDGPDGHGKHFQAKAYEINTSSKPDHQRPPQGYNITIHHTMLNEVRSYQTHHWKCQKCSNVVRRAMNRKPQEADCRTRQGAACVHPRCYWHQHLKNCGGEYIKVAEPEGFGEKKKRKPKVAGQALPVKRPRSKEGVSGAAITDFFKRAKLGAKEIPDVGTGQPGASASGSAPGTASPDLSREEMRRTLAEAATRRLQGNLGKGYYSSEQPNQGDCGVSDRLPGDSIQEPEASTSRQAEDEDDWLVELDDWGPSPGSGEQDLSGQGSPVNGSAGSEEQLRGPPEIDKPSSSKRGGSGTGSEEAIGTAARAAGVVGVTVACPICSRKFQDISNADMNAHIDGCLTQQSVIVLD